jgi:hypothetical protein
LVSSGLSLHGCDLTIDASLGGSGSSFSLSTGLSSRSSDSFGLLAGSLSIGFTLESHLMLQLKFSMGSLELSVLFLGSINFGSQSLGFGIGSVDFSLSASIFGVTESLQLSLLIRVLLSLIGSFLRGNTVFLGICCLLLCNSLSVGLFSDGAETISFSLGSLLSKTLCLSLLSLDGGDALFFGNASILRFLPGGETSSFTLLGESLLTFHGLSKTGLDSRIFATFLTSGTESLLFGQGLLMLDSLSFGLLGKLLLAFKLGLLQGSSGFSGGHFRSSSVGFGIGNGFLGLSSAASLGSVTLSIFHRSLGLGSSKLSGEPTSLIGLSGFLLKAFELGFIFISSLFSRSGGHLFFMSSIVNSFCLFSSSSITGGGLSLGLLALLSSLCLQFGLLLCNLSLRISFQRIKSGLGIGSSLLLGVCTRLSK